MKQSTKLAVIGGDVRQAYLAELLCADGHEVRVFALERHFVSGCTPITDLRAGLSDIRAVILPMPVQHGEALLNAPLSNAPHSLSSILDAVPAGTLTLAGAVPFSMHARSVQNELRLIDYLSRDELAIRNAVPTCEGALQIAMEQTAFTLQGSNCLVIGNGRIGKLLAEKLRALAANVTVSARSARDFALIDAAGMSAIHTRNLTNLDSFDLIFNTVPAAILGSAEFSSIKKACIIIDLASLPGGIVPDTKIPPHCKVIPALSLPGRVAPLSAARAIHQTILTILQEEGVL